MKYVIIHVELTNHGPCSSQDITHRQIIEEQADQGNRFVTWIPVKYGPSGKLLSMDLIFEKDTLSLV